MYMIYKRTEITNNVKRAVYNTVGIVYVSENRITQKKEENEQQSANVKNSLQFS